MAFITSNHYTKLWTQIHASGWFRICNPFVFMHALDCSDTTGDIKVHFVIQTHVVHTSLIKDLDIKMRWCRNIMPWKYVDKVYCSLDFLVNYPIPSEELQKLQRTEKPTTAFFTVLIQLICLSFRYLTAKIFLNNEGLMKSGQ